MEHYKFLNNLTKKYFEKYNFGYLLSETIYSWTTANFFRQKLILNYRYDCGLFSEYSKIDVLTVSEIISRANWYDYTPYNLQFMKSFMLKNVTRSYESNKSAVVEEIYKQALDIFPILNEYVFSEARIFNFALRNLPPIVDQSIILSRGAFIYGIEINEIDKFCELDKKIWYNITEIQNVLLPGKVFSTRTPWSFCNKIEDAKKYSQGVLINAVLDSSCKSWGCYFISEFSINVSKIEYTCPIGTIFKIDNIEYGNLIELNITILSCGEQDLLAANSEFLSYDC